MKLIDGKPDKEAEHAALLIGKYEKLLNAAIRLGFCYNDDIVTYLHNERAYWINKVLQDSNNEIIAVVWKNGTVHIYDRLEYCKHKYGKKKY